MREEFRSLTDREREILLMLLSVEMSGIEELRVQAAHSRAARWKCGCASFNLIVDKNAAPRSAVTARPVAEAITKQRDDADAAFDLLLWVEDGWLHSVEIVDYMETHGDDSPDEIPPPEVWDVPAARAPQG